jgi:hypothetical protein
MLYKWSIEKVVVAEDNLVTNVYWRCEAEGFACSGVRDLVRSDSFTAYDKLTEQQVLEWCFEPEVITFLDYQNNQQSTTKMLKDEAETQVLSQIQRQSDLVKSEPSLPWV